MNNLKSYYFAVKDLIDKLYEKSDVYKKAARVIANAVKEERLVHIAGTEMHSSMAAEDVFYREGNFVNINPLFDPTFSVTHSASRSLYLREADYCGDFLIDYYRNIRKGDVFIIVDNSGIGRACCEMVRKSKEKGLYTIAISSSQYAKSIDKNSSLRNDEKINLYDMAGIDVIIDNEVPVYDTVVETEAGKKAGWVSTIANSFILNMIFLEALTILKEENADPDVWHNFYDENGMVENEKLIEKYYDRIKQI